MATSGILTFHSCHDETVASSGLGYPGDYDHLGFFGLNGPDDAVIVENWNDSTWFVDSVGTRDTSVWHALMNNKYVDISGCSTSGHPRALVSIYQDADHVASGTLHIKFVGSGALMISTYNARLYAYDNTGAISDPPANVTLMGFEINPSGDSGAIEGYAVPTEWTGMATVYNGIEFVDHSPVTKYFPGQNQHDWYCAVSARADAVGFLDDFDITFLFQFA